MKPVKCREGGGDEGREKNEKMKKQEKRGERESDNERMRVDIGI